MTIFITGGTSSIGRVLIKELAREGCTMRVLVRPGSNRAGLELPGVEFVPGDVTDPDSVRRGMEGCTQVTHLAAVVGANLPEAVWWQVNRDGTRTVLQAAFDQGVSSMVQVSSISVLGCTEPGETADESRPIDTSRYVNLYQKTKHAADENGRDFAARGLPVKIVYPGFGFGCSWASSHPSLQEMTLLRMAAGKPVGVLGSGKNRLLAAYYKDTAAAIQLAHARGKPGEGYLLGNESLTFPEIWAAIAQVMGKRPPTRRIPLGVLKTVSSLSERVLGRTIFPPDFFDMIALNWCFSNRKAREALGWRPKSFLEGIEETWEAYQREGWTGQGKR